MTGIWIFGGVLTFIVVALLLVLLGLGRKPSARITGGAADFETTKEGNETRSEEWKGAKVWAKENQVWVGLVLCHLALIIFFPGIWLSLARVPGFWLAQVFLFIAFGFLKDEKTKKLNGWGQAIVCVVIVAVVAGFIGSSHRPSLPVSTGSARRFSLPSLNPFGSSLPDENEEMKGMVVKFRQDNLPDDQTGQQKMIATAEEATHFNQFEENGRTIRREVGGRWKVGVMGIDQGLWSWAGIGSGLDISITDGNLRGALYLYKTYKSLAWRSAERIRPTSVVIPVPANDWTEYITVRTGAYLMESGDTEIVTERNAHYLDGPDRRLQVDPPAKQMKFKSASGRPEVVVVNR